MWDHSYCSVPSQQTECDSWLGVKKQFRLLGMEAGSPVIFDNLSTEGNLEIIYLLPDYLIRSRLTFSWRPDPLSQAADAFQQNLFRKSLYAFSPFCMIPKVLSKVLKDKVTIWWSLYLQPGNHNCGTQKRWECSYNNQFYWPGGEISQKIQKVHPVVQNKTLKLVALTVSGLDYKIIFFFKFGLTTCKAEQPLQDMKLQKKEAQKDYIIQEICLERTYF